MYAGFTETTRALVWNLLLYIFSKMSIDSIVFTSTGTKSYNLAPTTEINSTP